MPRRKATTDDDDALALGALDQDPTPTPAKRGPGRPRKATTTPVAGNRGKVAARTPQGRIMSKAQMLAKAQGEVYTYLTLAHAAWSLRDPECAAATEKHIAELADKVTAMIARNDAALAFVANSGVIGDALGLGGVLLSIGKVIWTAHGPNGHGHGQPEQIDETTYPPFRG